MAFMAPLPNQNQLYAFYLRQCGHYRVGKPHPAVLELLVEDEPSYHDRLQQEAVQRQVEVAELKEMEEDGLRSAAGRAAVVPLAHRLLLQLGVRASGEVESGLHLGARGMMALLDLLTVLPLVEEVDFSNLASWYAADAFATGEGHFEGNAVVRHLATIASTHPSLQTIRLHGQPLGTMAGHALLQAVEANPRLRGVSFSREGVDYRLCAQLDRALAGNARRAAGLPPPTLPTVLDDRLRGLPVLDRKTLREQQLLRALLEADPHFSDFLTPEHLGTLVLHARGMSTTEAIFRCRSGLRGDGDHLFILKSGLIRAKMDLQGFILQRGDYFGDTYADVIVPACTLEEVERGIVYGIPLTKCQHLLEGWNERLRSRYAWMRTVPLLQSVDAWTRVRVCTCSTMSTYAPGDTVIPVGDTRRALWIVQAGDFFALRGEESGGGISGKGEPYPFAPGDVMGIESLVARRHCSSVDVVAGKNKENTYVCVQVTGSAARLLTEMLRPVFVSLARSYSTHEDLRPVARRGETVKEA